ncbi:hypothetical protein BT69DRAFT_1334053 [Atractiella rhizophila]|nr:hypothetical protein BT69DRAFT_1334053 [Atractiella rhizophila]
MDYSSFAASSQFPDIVFPTPRPKQAQLTESDFSNLIDILTPSYLPVSASNMSTTPPHAQSVNDSQVPLVPFPLQDSQSSTLSTSPPTTINPSGHWSRSHSQPSLYDPQMYNTPYPYLQGGAVRFHTPNHHTRPGLAAFVAENSLSPSSTASSPGAAGVLTPFAGQSPSYQSDGSPPTSPFSAAFPHANCSTGEQPPVLGQYLNVGDADGHRQVQRSLSFGNILPQIQAQSIPSSLEPQAVTGQYLNASEADNQHSAVQIPLSQENVPSIYHQQFLAPSPLNAGPSSYGSTEPWPLRASPAPSSEGSYSSQSSEYGGPSDGSIYAGDTTGSEDLSSEELSRMIASIRGASLQEEHAQETYVDPRVMSASFGIADSLDPSSKVVPQDPESGYPDLMQGYQFLSSLATPSSSVPIQYPVATAGQSVEWNAGFSDPTPRVTQGAFMPMPYSVYYLPNGTAVAAVNYTQTPQTQPSTLDGIPLDDIHTGYISHVREQTMRTLRGTSVLSMDHHDGTLRGTQPSAEDNEGSTMRKNKKSKARKSLADAFGSDADADGETEEEEDEEEALSIGLKDQLKHISQSEDDEKPSRQKRSSSAARPQGSRKISYAPEPSEVRGRKPPRLTDVEFVGAVDPDTGEVLPTLTFTNDGTGPTCGGMQALTAWHGFTPKTGKLMKWFGCAGSHKECRKVFRRSEHWKRHVRSVHLMEKPFECLHPGCGKFFSRGDNFKQHLKIHRCSDNCCAAVNTSSRRTNQESGAALKRKKKAPVREKDDDDFVYSEDH